MVEKSGASVFMVTDNKARKMTVKTGFKDGAMVEILDGLKLNDAVILLGKNPPNNDQPVSPQEIK